MKSPKGIGLIFGFFFLISLGCQKENDRPETGPDIMQIPVGFPAMTFPEGNEYTPERWALGKQLFNDPILSRSNTISCASCHKPSLAFSDEVAFSIGEGDTPGRSNAPTLTNIGYHPYFTRAGGVPTLEMQVLVPVQEHDEFDFNIVEIAKRLKEIPTYVEAARAAYDREPDPFVITRALANFERSFISGNSKYDKFIYQENIHAINAAEKRGMNLFFGEKTNCSGCHNGFNFTSYAFENNGLYETYADSGRMRFTQDPNDRAKFKVPTLRNVGVTGPYMHDGSFTTLEDVVAHYNIGGTSHLSKSPLVAPLGLTEQEKDDLVAFLHVLTDTDFLFNEHLKQP